MIMVVREFYRIREDGVRLYKTYSDSNKYIYRLDTEDIYSEAIDVENAPYQYEETEREIEVFEDGLNVGVV